MAEEETLNLRDSPKPSQNQLIDTNIEDSSNLKEHNLLYADVTVLAISRQLEDTSIELGDGGGTLTPEVPAKTDERSKPLSPTKASYGGRPGLTRELSAASLTRAVMSGSVPVTTTEPAKSMTPEKPNETPKKSAWNRLFPSDEDKKNKAKAKSSSRLQRTASADDTLPRKEDSSRLFNSLFGSKKKPQDASNSPTKRIPFNQLTGAHSDLSSVVEIHYFNRYPINLERAIYRMAHLKLSNNKRPLLHQVTLSNFMYAYLALIGAGYSQGNGERVQRIAHHQPRQKENRSNWHPRPGSHTDSGHAGGKATRGNITGPMLERSKSHTYAEPQRSVPTISASSNRPRNRRSISLDIPRHSEDSVEGYDNARGVVAT